MARKSKERVRVEIEALKALQGRIRPFSTFGDDNEAALAVQIDTLEYEWTYADVSQDYSGFLYDQARDAIDWREDEDGRGMDGLAEDWELLLKEE